MIFFYKSLPHGINDIILPMKPTTSKVIAIAYFTLCLMLSLVVKFALCFALLSLARFVYVIIRSQNFSFLWPSRGAFFLTVVYLASYLLRFSSIEDVVVSRLKKIPYKMLGAIGFILLITTLYRGATCFWGKDTFLVLDVRWLGTICLGVGAALLICGWELLKAMCVSAWNRFRPQKAAQKQVAESVQDGDILIKPLEPSSPQEPSSIFDTISFDDFNQNSCAKGAPPDNSIQKSDWYEQALLFDESVLQQEDSVMPTKKDTAEN